MKKTVTISLFIFWMIVTAVLAAGLIIHDNSQTGKSTVPGMVSDGGIATNSQDSVRGSENTMPKAQKIVLSMAELLKHNSGKSCWLLISGKIYDVTNFINLHPGNAKTIVSNCGQDATQAYDTKDGKGKPHSGNANAMLADYYIGNLNQSLNLQNTSGGAGATSLDLLPAPKPKAIPSRGEDDDD